MAGIGSAIDNSSKATDERAAATDSAILVRGNSTGARDRAVALGGKATYNKLATGSIQVGAKANLNTGINLSGAKGTINITTPDNSGNVAAFAATVEKLNQQNSDTLRALAEAQSTAGAAGTTIGTAPPGDTAATPGETPAPETDAEKTRKRNLLLGGLALLGAIWFLND